MGRTVTKSIAIIGEGETEWFYFDSLRIACRYPFKVAPDFPQHSDINHILKLVESYLNKQYDYIVCLFDMDRLFQFPSEMQLYQRAKKKYGAKKYAERVMFVETNPCTEFWFLLHFLPNMVCRRYDSYEQLLPELQKYMPGYEKTKRYFIRTNLYKYLTENGYLERAMSNSEKLCQLCKESPEDLKAYSEIHKVIKLLMVNYSMDKIYLYKTAVKSVSYDETHWYINGEPQPQKDGDGIAEFKSNASAESFRIIANDIVRYTSHFKNVAVLTAAGTSMEMGRMEENKDRTMG